MREATPSKIRSGPQRGSWGARVEGEKPEIGEVVRVVRSTGHESFERLTAHVWSGLTREGEKVRVYATVPANSDIGQVTVGEMRQVAEQFREWGQMLIKGQVRRAGEAMIDFGGQMIEGYAVPEPEEDPTLSTPKGGKPCEK